MAIILRQYILQILRKAHFKHLKFLKVVHGRFNFNKLPYESKDLEKVIYAIRD